MIKYRDEFGSAQLLCKHSEGGRSGHNRDNTILSMGLLNHWQYGLSEFLIIMGGGTVGENQGAHYSY